MKTLFYKRTPYSIFKMPVPKCFIELDEYFDTIFPTWKAIFHPPVVLAENLCHRMADVEAYAYYITEEQKGVDTIKSAILIGTLLVGFFTSCKSVLDAGAIALDTLYNLHLPEKEQDFAKSELLRRLKKETGSVIYDRYDAFKSLIEEIRDWRNSAVHRHTPFVVSHGPRDAREKQEIKLANHLDMDLNTIVGKLKSIKWVEPLYYHKKWQGQLIMFCKEICLDIRSQTPSFAPPSS